jgi:hypothetical protein
MRMLQGIYRTATSPTVVTLDAIFLSYVMIESWHFLPRLSLCPPSCWVSVPDGGPAAVSACKPPPGEFTRQNILDVSESCAKKIPRKGTERTRRGRGYDNGQRSRSFNRYSYEWLFFKFRGFELLPTTRH